MKKIKIYFAALIAVFAVTMGALPVAAEQNTANGFNMPEYYVETALENELGKEKYFKAYNAIKNGVENFESEIRLGTEVDENEIRMIFNSYRSDHPEHFWLNPVTLPFGTSRCRRCNRIFYCPGIFFHKRADVRRNGKNQCRRR